jgi:5'(3')-deoxyribonucleotidase
MLTGVLADTIRLWIRLWSRRSGRRLEYEDVVEWDFWRRLGTSVEELMRMAWRMWRALPSTEPNLSEKVARLRTLGRVDVVTARPRDVEKYALLWLRAHGIPFDDIVWIRSSGMKARLDYDVFIDDSPILVNGCVLKTRLLFLYDRADSACAPACSQTHSPHSHNTRTHSSPHPSSST